MDKDNIFPPDATAKELEELAIENACNPLQSLFATSSKAFFKPAASKKLSFLRFIDEMDVAIYQAMVIAQRQGLRSKFAGLKSQAWTHIVAAVQAQVTTGQTVVKKQCEGRKATQKLKWVEWKRLETLSRLGFDLATELYMASNKQWEKEIKVKSFGVLIYIY